MTTRLILIGILLWLSGCIAPVVRPAVEVQVEGKLDWSDWAAALAQARADGAVDYGRLIQDRLPLQRTLARIAKVGPTLMPGEFPNDKARLSYLINCYNATILETVVQLLERSSFSSGSTSFLEGQFRYIIDGRPMSPADLRREVLRAAQGDWRVVFALCDGHRVGPALFRNPFLPDLLDGQLHEAVRAAIASDSVVAVSHGERKLMLWKELYSLQRKLIEEYETRVGTKGATMLDVLLSWADEDRRFTLNSAIGYDTAVMPDDGQLNNLTPPVPENKQSVFARLASFSLLKTSK